MALDDNILDESLIVRVRDSFNNTSTTTNTNALVVDLDNVGNTDASVNDSGNTDIDLDNVGNSDSHDIDVDIDDSFNVDSSVNDNSINAGVREYNTGFGDITVGGGGGGHGWGGGGGDVEVDNRSTIVDQSINANIVSGGGVAIGAANVANVASGDESLAAGDDIDLSTNLDASTTIAAYGDVNIGNETTVDITAFSNNSYVDNSSEVDNSWDVDIDDSFNDESVDVDIEDSFNDETVAVTTTDWDIDANVIWGSDAAIIVSDVDVDLPDV